VHAACAFTRHCFWQRTCVTMATSTQVGAARRQAAGTAWAEMAAIHPPRLMVLQRNAQKTFGKAQRASTKRSRVVCSRSMAVEPSHCSAHSARAMPQPADHNMHAYAPPFARQRAPVACSRAALIVPCMRSRAFLETARRHRAPRAATAAPAPSSSPAACPCGARQHCTQRRQPWRQARAVQHTSTGCRPWCQRHPQWHGVRSPAAG